MRMGIGGCCDIREHFQRNIGGQVLSSPKLIDKYDKHIIINYGNDCDNDNDHYIDNYVNKMISLLNIMITVLNKMITVLNKMITVLNIITTVLIK